jgi:Cu-Zn family superoxide dismutase
MKQSISFLMKSVLAAALISFTCFFSFKDGGFKGKHAEAVVTGTKADTVVQGTLKFEQLKNGSVKMKLELYVPKKANQTVAVHFHEHGMCGNAGMDAHGHWNPTNKSHGKWGSASFHSGDIGNIKLDAKGKGKLELTTKLWSIGGPDSTNIVGRGVIVHSGVDDYTSQPAGNAGSRIGCGEIKAKE